MEAKYGLIWDTRDSWKPNLSDTLPHWGILPGAVPGSHCTDIFEIVLHEISEYMKAHTSFFVTGFIIFTF